jgi:hypothetical protein
MKKLSALETGLETAAETQINAGKNTYETDDKNQTKTQFIFSHVFYRTPYGHVQKTTI